MFPPVNPPISRAHDEQRARLRISLAGAETVAAPPTICDRESLVFGSSLLPHSTSNLHAYLILRTRVGVSSTTVDDACGQAILS